MSGRYIAPAEDGDTAVQTARRLVAHATLTKDLVHCLHGYKIMSAYPGEDERDVMRRAVSGENTVADMRPDVDYLYTAEAYDGRACMERERGIVVAKDEKDARLKVLNHFTTKLSYDNKEYMYEIIIHPRLT